MSESKTTVEAETHQPNSPGTTAANREDEEDDLEEADMDDDLEDKLEENLEGQGIEFNLYSSNKPALKNKSNPNIPDNKVENLVENLAIMNVLNGYVVPFYHV